MRRFGPLARSLEARALSSGNPAGPGDAARVLFVPGALPPAERAVLAGLPGTRILARGALEELDCPAEALTTASAGHPGLECLLEAHRRARAPRPRPRVMGILNVTPDSFSDGGLTLAPERAVERGLKLVAEGADMLDVGGESTRPGAAPVSTTEELDRVMPVIEGLAGSTDTPLSIDTTKTEVAAQALSAGASIVNDVSAGRLAPDMLELVADREAEIILMHMQGEPRDMQAAPHYEDVVREVTGFFRERVASCLKAGIDAPRIAIDPGIGFGKRLKDNLDLIRALPELRSLGLPIVLGVSRKSFLGRLTGEDVPANRTTESVAAVSAGALLGADIHRVHDVAATATTLKVVGAIAEGSAP